MNDLLQGKLHDAGLAMSVAILFPERFQTQLLVLERLYVALDVSPRAESYENIGPR